MSSSAIYMIESIKSAVSLADTRFDVMGARPNVPKITHDKTAHAAEVPQAPAPVETPAPVVAEVPAPEVAQAPAPVVPEVPAPVASAPAPAPEPVMAEVPAPVASAPAPAPEPVIATPIITEPPTTLVTAAPAPPPPTIAVPDPALITRIEKLEKKLITTEQMLVEHGKTLERHENIEAGLLADNLGVSMALAPKLQAVQKAVAAKIARTAKATRKTEPYQIELETIKEHIKQALQRDELKDERPRKKAKHEQSR